MRARRSKGNPDGLNLFDSHCHLTDNQFAGDLGAVLKQAHQAGVRDILTASQNVPDSRESVALAARHASVYCAIGVHPHEADGFRSQDATALKELCIEPRIRAIGEIGLDFFRSISSRASQETAFRVQIDLARAMDLPMVLHVRDAAGSAKSILEEHGYFCGVMHCFTGDRKTAEWAVGQGFYISFAGNITYGDQRLAEVAKYVPADRLMVETDAPYLTPDPERGRRNEPANVRYTLYRIAELRGLGPREAAELTAANARRCFRIQ